MKLLWLIFFILIVACAYVYAFVWVVTKPFARWMKKNDEELSNDWEDTDAHPWINGDCCRCAVCTKQYHDELLGDVETTTELNHNLRNNR